MVIVVKAILAHKDKILLLRRSGTHPIYPYQYDLPGGEAANSETVESALKREIKEETGLTFPKPSFKLVFEKELDYGAKHIIYESVLKSGQPNIKLSWEHDGYFWLERKIILSQKYPDNLDPFFRDFIDYLKSIN